jgi:recombination protein U
MGKKKSPGKDFEKDFKDSIPCRCDVTRLKDSGGFDGKEMTNRRFASTNPCDFIIYSDKGYSLGLQNTVMYKLELKSLLKKSMPYSNIKGKTNKLTAKENSIKFTKALVESESRGVWAGFIINFRDTNQTFRVLASIVLNHLENSDRASIPIAWFEEHGTLIEQTLKKVHYRYDLEWL